MTTSLAGDTRACKALPTCPEDREVMLSEHEQLILDTGSIAGSDKDVNHNPQSNKTQDAIQVDVERNRLTLTLNPLVGLLPYAGPNIHWRTQATCKPPRSVPSIIRSTSSYSLTTYLAYCSNPQSVRIRLSELPVMIILMGSPDVVLFVRLSLRAY